MNNSDLRVRLGCFKSQTQNKGIHWKHLSIKDAPTNLPPNHEKSIGKRYTGNQIAIFVMKKSKQRVLPSR